jgi:ribonuclease T2
MVRFNKSLAAVAVLMLLAIPALAQFGPGPGGRAPYGGKNEPGKFDYYSMVMSWSPTHCATNSRGPNDTQCNPPRGRQSYAFVLHGLWPQHERGFPESCPTRDRPFVPQPTIDRMMDIMPSSGLIVHQYRKHGTCSGLSPDNFFELSRKLFNKVKVPARYERPNQAFFVTPRELVNDFVSVNPGLKPDMLAVVCGGPGGRMREVRVCFSREGEFRSCGANENPRRLCSLDRMFVPPVREVGGPRQSSPPPPPRPSAPQQGPLPGPGERRI